MSSNIPKLCGGILFCLILQGTKNRIAVKNGIKHSNDGLNECEIMNKLVWAVGGDDVKDGSDNFRKATTSYKTCVEDKNTYINFTDVTFLKGFNNAVKRKDSALLHRMKEFVDYCINIQKSESFVKMLLDTIQQDASIADDVEFHISNSNCVKKKEFGKIKEVNLPVFLQSVLHYIFNNVNSNTAGRATFENWHYQESNRGKWKFKSCIGDNIRQDIKIISTEASFVSTSDNVLNKCSYSSSSHQAADKIEDETDLWNTYEEEHDLKREALIILAYASTTINNECVICRLGTKTENILTVNGVDFINNSAPREVLKWQEAIDELDYNGYIESTSYKREIFNLTTEGWDLGEKIRTKLEIDIKQLPEKFLR